MNKPTMPTLAPFMQHSDGSRTQSNNKRKVRDIQIGKEVNFPFPADDMILICAKSKRRYQKTVRANKFKVSG